MFTIGENDLEDNDNMRNYNSADSLTRKKGSHSRGGSRERKNKSFYDILKFKRNIEIDTNLESETECKELETDR